MNKLNECIECGNLTKHAFESDDGEGLKSRLVIWNHPGKDYSGLFGRCRRIVDTTESVS